MATVAELRSRIDTLQRELDGMSPVNTKPVQVQVGTREERVGRGSRTVPVYATVNETTQNADYFSKLSALNKARDQYQTAFTKQAQKEGVDYLRSLYAPADPVTARTASLPAEFQGANLATFGLNRPMPAMTYARGFTPDVVADPEAPSQQNILSREEFFNQVFKPNLGGDRGIIDQFYGGGGTRQGGRNPAIDGTPRTPTFDQLS